MKHLKRFNESKENLQEELQDFCEMNLAYLMDEELDISVTPVKGGFKLTLVLDNNPRLWDDIKNHMIPFLTRLSNQFQIRPYANKGWKNISIEVTRDLEAAKNHWPHRKSQLYYEVPRLINDDTKSGIFYDDNTDYFVDVLESYITEFEFIIDGYKQPKKGILTKIKSFFK